MEDKQCGKGRFCDLHYGVCRTEKSPGFACRRDRMCGKGLACMFGRCQAKIPTGEEGKYIFKNLFDLFSCLCSLIVCQPLAGLSVKGHRLFLPQRLFDGSVDGTRSCFSC